MCYFPGGIQVLKKVVRLFCVHYQLQRSMLASEQQNKMVGTLNRPTNWLTGTATAIAALSLLARHWWVADLIANLRVQLIFGLMGTTVLLTIIRSWRPVVLMTIVTLWQATFLLSACQNNSNSSLLSQSIDSLPIGENLPGLRVFLANVLTRNLHHDQIIAQIEAADPDVIVILELSSQLRDVMQMEFGTSHEYVIAEYQDDGNFGIGLWSRYPLTEARIFHLNSQYLPSIEANVECHTRTIRVFATHPLPPVGVRNFQNRNQHLALLAKRIQEQRNAAPMRPILVLGDLNMTPWSPLFQDFLTQTELQSAAAGCGLRPTWYRWNAFPFGLILDHGLHSSDVLCKDRRILPANGSDHRAVVFDFSLIAPG